VIEKGPPHLVWDWNGTVLNDFDVGFRSANSSFRDAGLPEITTAMYRGLLRTPVRGFYAAVLGRDPSDEERDALEQGFHSYYRCMRRRPRCRRGTAPPYPERKAAHLADHLARLKVDPAAAVLIGDVVDDAHAAAQAGASVVLYSGGFGARAGLAATGAPVAGSLAEAVELIGGL